jgi:hypothetical protein
MSHERIDRNGASRIAIGARAGACVLGVCGMAIAVFGVPGASTIVSPPAAAAQPEAVELEDTPHEDAPVLDAPGIAMRLATVGNAPKPPPEPVIEETGEELASGDMEQAPVSDEVSFLGLIREPGRVLALVRVGGKQTVMWVGREISGVRLAEIGDGFITIERDGATQRVDRASKKGEAFTRLEQTQPVMPTAQDPAAAEQALNSQTEPDGEMSREELLRRVREQARGQQRMIRRPPGEGRERFGDPGERQWRDDR